MRMSRLPQLLYRSKEQPRNNAVPIFSTIQQAFGQSQSLSIPKPDALFGFNVEQLLDELALQNKTTMFEKGSYNLTKEDGKGVQLLLWFRCQVSSKEKTPGLLQRTSRQMQAPLDFKT